MTADVSRALARFIAAFGLDREVAREFAGQFADVDSVADLPDWVREVDDDGTEDDPDLDTIRSYVEQDADESDVERAAGHDVTPGHDELHHWWTKGPGLARWIESPHQFTTLRDQLVEEAHVAPEVADRWAAAWVHEVTGFWPGSDMHRVLEGGKPRGHRIGPG